MSEANHLTGLNDYYNLSRNELVERIKETAKQKNARILAHNYQRLEIQNLADHVGDSLQLARIAADTDLPVIVFCGVHFMAESAAILSPEKTVILPAKNAGCPMADMINAEQLREFKSQHPGAVVVCYVNSSAAVKSESDVCCTSSNAVNVVNSLKGEKILFVPDRNLAAYTQKMTGADIIPWEGYCYVHNRFTADDVSRAKTEHPEAAVVVHPECRPEVTEKADHIASTAGMITFAEKDIHTEFIVGTEIGLVEQLQEKLPKKRFFPLKKEALCANMKLTDLAKLAYSIDHNQHIITVPDSVRVRAENALKRMVEL